MTFMNVAEATLPRYAVGEAATTVPWYCYALVFGIACIPIGVLWDISWHSTIGRDTFWTPAHIVTYLGGLVPGLTCGWLALKTHFFGTAREREAAVSFWGFRAPLGAWMTIWGAFTMLLSAPFDDWWHNAYGLDVEILSPPHSVLALGMFGVGVGVLLLLISAQNRSGEFQGSESWMVITVFGLLVTMAAIFLTEKGLPNLQHTAGFYTFSAATFPVYLAAAARGAKLRWPATTAAAIYMIMNMLINWTLPLFAAEPKLAPIYHPVDHMVPLAFPLLLVAPALAMDLVIRWLGSRRGFFRDSLLSILVGAVFLAVFLAVQWHFSKFMLSPAADNWFFTGNRFWPYYANPSEWWSKFWDTRPWVNDPLTMRALGVALLLAIVATRIGLGVGNWLSKVRR
jgi:hypothetical protein